MSEKECESGNRVDFQFSSDYYDLAHWPRETGHFSRLSVWGSHSERGYAQGFLMADEIINLFDNYIVDWVIEEQLRDQLAGNDPPARYDTYRTKFLGSFTVEQRFQDEADGIARGLSDKGKESARLGRELNRDDVLATNAIVDMTQCLACSSASAVRGRFPRPGPAEGMLLARNLDWECTSSVDGNIALSDAPVVVAHEPTADGVERKWVSIGFAGFIGALSGMNEEGVVAVHQLASPEKISFDQFGSQGTKFTPINFAIRECLETIGTSDEEANPIQRMVDLLSYPGAERCYLVPGSNIIHMMRRDYNSSPPNAVIEHYFNFEEPAATAVMRADTTGWERTFDNISSSKYLAATNFHLVRVRVGSNENPEGGDRYNKLTPDPNITNPSAPITDDYWYNRTSVRYATESVPNFMDEIITSPPKDNNIKTNNMHWYRDDGFKTREIWWQIGSPTLYPQPNVREVAFEHSECEPWRQGWDLMKSVCQYDITSVAPPRMFTWQTMVFEPDPGTEKAHIVRVAFGTPISTGDGAYSATNSTNLEPWVLEWNELFTHEGGQVPAPSPIIRPQVRLLRFVYKENSRGKKPSIATISKTLSISSVTANHLVKQLADQKLVRVVKAGEEHVLEATNLGKLKAQKYSTQTNTRKN